MQYLSLIIEMKGDNDMDFKQDIPKWFEEYGNFEHNSPDPQVGKEYWAYDDGKIRLSRQSRVKIIDKINLDDLSNFNSRYPYTKKELLEIIQDEIETYYWVYTPSQTFVFIGECLRDNENEDKEYSIFLRTKHNEWFGSGLLASLLDTDNYYTNNYIKN